MRLPDRSQNLSITSLLLLLLFTLLGLLPACTTVRFNQKAHLAQPCMVFDRDPLAAEVRSDILTTREGAIGGFSSAGAGGCGCN